MADLNFPPNPTVGDTYTIGSRTWVWNGTAWQLQSGIQNLDPFTVKTLIVTSATISTSTNTGAVIIEGGVGVGADVNIGGDLTVDGTLYANISGLITTATNIDGGFTGAIPYQSSTGTTTFSNDLTFSNGNLYAANEIYENDVRVLTNVSPSAGLGILVDALSTVSGNVSFIISNTGVLSLISSSADLSISSSTGDISIVNLSTLQSVTDRGSTTTNVIRIQNVTESTSATTGALVVDGGVGISGNVWIDGILYAGGQAVLTTASFFSAVSEGNDIRITEGANNVVVISNTSTLQTVTTRGSTTTNAIKILNTSVSTSTESGAIVVSGGVGIGGDLYVGQTLSVQTTVASPDPVTVNTSPVVLDTFPVNQYRSAKYFISISNPGANLYQTSEIWLIQDDVSAHIEQTSVFSNGVNVAQFETSVSGGNVSLIATGLNPNNSVKIHKTYITV